ncbi:MAG: carbon-nitrogen hydrolase family protein [Clostridiales bacterium]|nr:carbon-nitrogen hydrolase family protein [Clostridiales bacterium]
MIVSLMQTSVSDDKRENLARAEALSKRADGADIIMLPEMFCCPYSSDSFVKNAEPYGGRVTETLSAIAAKRNAIVIGGSMPEADGGRIYNTSFVFGKSGELIAKHRKAHLFDINVEGGQRFFESETLSAGDSATVFDTPFGRAGVCVCFDIRFSDFVNGMKADMLFVPAAFNMTTGPMHWELLFRARAVDSQMFAFGCAPARNEKASYVSYANSIAVDPWGRVIARAGTGETVLNVAVDPEETKRARAQIPIGN